MRGLQKACVLDVEHRKTREVLDVKLVMRESMRLVGRL